MPIKINPIYILLIAIVIVLCGFFFIGAYTSCVRGGGTLGPGFKCMDVKVIDACENFQGKIFRLPENKTFEV